MQGSEIEKYECPVCYFQMLEPAADYNICPRCGTEFENDDDGTSHEELRKRWIKKGCVFMYRAPTVGLATIEVGSSYQGISGNVRVVTEISGTRVSYQWQNKRGRVRDGWQYRKQFIAWAIAVTPPTKETE